MNGIDISNNNRTVDWTGVEFAFIKATEGLGYIDPTAAGFIQTATGLSIPWAEYHFPHPDVNSAKDEADFFLRWGHKGPMDPALDFETRQGVSPLAVMGVQAGAAWIDEWCDRVAQAWQQKPYLYTFRDYADKLFPVVGDHPIWLAGAKGQPTYKEYAGRLVTIEQWGQSGGLDRNISYLPILGEDMPLVQADLEAIDRIVLGRIVENNSKAGIQGAADHAVNGANDILAAIAKIPAGAGGGLTEDQVRTVVRDELNKTHLTA